MDFASLDAHFGYETETANAAVVEKENKSQPAAIALLDSKRTLSVNVFLRSFKGAEGLIEQVRGSRTSTEQSETADDESIERLRMLVPLLPSDEECQTLRNYTGERSVLGTAEQFLLSLLAVPDYALRIEAVLLRDELAAFALTVDAELNSLLIACRGEKKQSAHQGWLDFAELLESRHLRSVLFILLHIGNYLNHGGGLGNAVAFKVSETERLVH